MKSILFSLLILTTAGHTASFDCDKASTKTEHLICDTPSLSVLDLEMSEIYKKLDKNNKYFREFRKQQIDWLKQRSDWLDSPEWFEKQMKKQIHFLEYASSTLECISNEGFSEKCTEITEVEFETCWLMFGYSNSGGRSCQLAQSKVWEIVGATERKIHWEMVQLKAPTSDDRISIQSSEYKSADDKWNSWMHSHCTWIQSSGGTMDDLTRAGCVKQMRLERAKRFYEYNN